MSLSDCKRPFQLVQAEMVVGKVGRQCLDYPYLGQINEIDRLG